MIALTSDLPDKPRICDCCGEPVVVVVLFCRAELCKQCLSDALAMALDAERRRLEADRIAGRLFCSKSREES